MTYTDRITAMLRAAATSADHHLYYRSLNRAAGVISCLAMTQSRNGAEVPRELLQTAAETAERVVESLRRELGSDFPGYGGRPLFPALRRRVAEALIELGY